MGGAQLGSICPCPKIRTLDTPRSGIGVGHVGSTATKLLTKQTSGPIDTGDGLYITNNAKNSPISSKIVVQGPYNEPKSGSLCSPTTPKPLGLWTRHVQELVLDMLEARLPSY